MSKQVKIEDVFAQTNNEKFDAEIEKRAQKRNFFTCMSWSAVYSAQVGISPYHREKREVFDTKKLKEANYLHAGGFMERIAEGMKLINEEIQEAIVTTENLFNELRTLYSHIMPIMKNHVDALRSQRMVTVSEISSSLTTLKDIRKFFLESDYEKETERLVKFVALCKELERLKNDGTLDIVSDTLIKLALKEG